MRLRYCSIYFMLGDYSAAERVARDAIEQIRRIRGQDSPLAFQPKLFLEEALFYQGKYKETIAQGEENYAQFNKVLGPQNQMTMSALEVHAAAEGATENYADAIRDDLALNALERSNGSGKHIEEESLVTAASLECRAGRFNDGLRHARQVVQESSAPGAAQPLFVNLGYFAIAECLISQQEARPDHAAPTALREADVQLTRIDFPLLAHAAGVATFPGDFNVAEARLALLRGQIGVAKDFADKAAPFESRPDADLFEKKALAKV
jgi:ATP/maltotriose-dependent transcriptional regulator MalT